MSGETNLQALIKGMAPKLNVGDYVFVTTKHIENIDRSMAICEFREAEGTTLIIEKKHADKLSLSYDYVSAWITLEVHSSLDAVGLTAAFASELAKHNLSCNVVAGYYHDHLFVSREDADTAMQVLRNLATAE